MTKTAIPPRDRQARAPVSSPLKIPSVSGDQILDVFESLVHRLAADRVPSATMEPASAALLEIEHNGRTYSLFCRRKTIVTGGINLSPREREIVRMIAEGYPNKAVAAVLEISEWTVGTHLRRIFAKLGVSCRAAMVARWLELQ